jgi:hypothetical protein
MTHLTYIDQFHGDENECHGNCGSCNECDDSFYQMCDEYDESYFSE